jgi:RNA polymerase sigma-70 factor (ECF subfamily)
VAPGRYQILAAISAVHTSARDVRDTDWSQVVALYDQLVRLDPLADHRPQPGRRGRRA